MLNRLVMRPKDSTLASAVQILWTGTQCKIEGRNAKGLVTSPGRSEPKIVNIPGYSVEFLLFTW